MIQQEWKPNVDDRVTVNKYDNKAGTVIGVSRGEVCVKLDTEELVVIERRACKRLPSREEMTEEAMRTIDADPQDYGMAKGFIERMIAAGYRIYSP